MLFLQREDITSLIALKGKFWLQVQVKSFSLYFFFNFFLHDQRQVFAVGLTDLEKKHVEA